jgi:DNA polymerase-3 subunit delta'
MTIASLPPVIRDVPGQDNAAAFLARALAHPSHAYLFSGPEGSGKRLAMRAFAAALLCPDGGCGDCRACRLALGERHPNMLLLEPTGPDILVGKDAQDPNTARWFASRAYLTPPEPGRKIMVVLQADRLRVEAADVLLKALEEPPTDTIFVLMSARPDELPETVRSRVQEIGFPPLSEAFVVDALMSEGVSEDLARLACRLAGGNLGRARRTAKSEHGLDSRTVALSVGAKAAAGPGQALGAAEELLAAAKGFRGVLGEELELEFEPFLDPNGKPEEAFKGIIRRMKDQHERRLRRAEREFLDSALLALAAHWRDVAVLASGGGPEMLINVDLAEELQAAPAGAAQAGLAMGHIEQARADLADETNLNARLVLERMFLKLARLNQDHAFVQ